MNQELVLNINNRSLIGKSNPQQQDVNNRSADDSKIQQAFSSELDRQIDKQEPPKGNQKISDKPQQQAVAADNPQQKAEKIDTENGKALPAEEQSEQAVESEDFQLTSEEIIEPEQLVLDIDVSQVDGEVKTSANTSDDSEQEQNPNKPVIAPAGLIKTQELHTAVQQIKDIITNAKASEEGVVKNQVGKTIAEVAQNISITEGKVKTPIANVASEIAQKTAAPTTPNLENTDGKQQSQQQGQSEAKIRPDILQALAVKPVITNKNTGNKNNKSVPAATSNTVIKQESILDKQLNVNVPEFIKQAKLIVQPSSSGQSDRSTGGFGSTLASLAHGQATSHTNRVVKAEAPTLDIQPTLQNKAWNRVLSSRVIWMAREGIQQASLKLNPASLGPVEVKVTMSNEQATVTFIAQHAATRDALEQALPRLRESFAENGLELADAEISQQSPEEAGEQENDDNMNGDSGSVNAASADNNEQEQLVVDIEQDLESGISIYA